MLYVDTASPRACFVLETLLNHFDFCSPGPPTRLATSAFCFSRRAHSSLLRAPYSAWARMFFLHAIPAVVSGKPPSGVNSASFILIAAAFFLLSFSIEDCKALRLLSKAISSRPV